MSVVFNPNMANREVANLIWYQYKSKLPALNLDYANVTTTGLTSNRVYAKGGQGGASRIGFDGERGGTLKIDTQITTMQLLGLISGSGVSESASIAKRIGFTTTSSGIHLPVIPSPGTVYVYKDGDDCGTPLEITVTDRDVSITENGFSDGDVIVYYIEHKATGAQTVSFSSKIFPKAFSIYGETPWKTEDEGIIPMSLVYYKAQPQPNFELAFSSTGDPTSLSITLDVLGDDKGRIYDMSRIDDEAV